MHKMKFNTPLKFLVAVCISLTLGCTSKAQESQKYTESKMLMGTVVRLDTCTEEIKDRPIDVIYAEIWGRLENISWRMNILDEKSDVARINQAFKNPVTVGTDTHQLLKQSIKFSKLTRGAFDITVWPLIKVWKEAQSKNIMPTREKIMEAKDLVGAENIKLLPEAQVKLAKKGVKVDLGGIAKGYAIDEAARIFREHDIESFFIDAGGDIYAGGLNCEGEHWRVGIRDPRNTSKFIKIVAITNAALATSGNYSQFFEIEGQKFSHIIDPSTGYPQKGVLSASVIAPTATEADALATALMILRVGEAAVLINGFKGDYASLILSGETDQMTQIPSEKFKEFDLNQQ